MSENPEDSIKNDGNGVGIGIGIIEFQGKTYPLNRCISYKMTSWNPPPLGFHFHYTEDGKYAVNVIQFAFSSNEYNSWPTLELPAGLHENISLEFGLDNYKTQGWSHYERGILEIKLDVKKSNDDYNLVFTGKAKLYLEDKEDNSLYDIKMTWKGKIPIATEDPYTSPL